MPKNVIIVLDLEDYARLKKAKRDRDWTWRQMLLHSLDKNEGDAPTSPSSSFGKIQPSSERENVIATE